jgi:hypothetical protein
MKLNWGTGIFIFIIIFLVLCGVFIVFSFNQNNDLVATDYYEQGAGYSKQIEINKRSAIYADSIQVVDYDSVVVAYVCKSIIQSSDSLELYFFRPSDKAHDFIAMQAITDSIKLPKTKFIHGRYKVILSWKQNNNKFMVEKDIFID